MHSGIDITAIYDFSSVETDFENEGPPEASIAAVLGMEEGEDE